MSKIVYKGEVYKSILQLYNATGVNRKALAKMIKNNDNEDSIILDELIDEYKKQKNATYKYNGKEYKSLTDAAKDLNINIKIISKYIKMADGDFEKAMELFENHNVYAVLDGVKYHNLNEIAVSLGVNRHTLSKYIEKEGSLENAYEKLKSMADEKIIWNGKEYKSLNSVADAMGIPRVTIKRIMEEEADGDINRAYEIYQKRNSGKYYGYSYNGKQYSSIKKMLTDLGLAANTFYRLLEQNGNDMEKTISLMLQKEEQKNKKKEENERLRKEKEDNKVIYSYNGETFESFRSLSKKIGISETSLRRIIPSSSEAKGVIVVDEMIDTFFESKITYTYLGKEFSSIKELADYTGIRDLRLGRYIRKYDRNAEKAIMIIMARDKASKKVNMNGTDISIADLATILGIKRASLTAYINKGMTIDEIKEHISKKDETKVIRKKRSSTIMYDNQKSLLQYCIENKLNYSCIYYAITEYGKTKEEAIEYYQKNGQKIPISWIYERYGVLLKHLLLNENIDYKKILFIMREKQVSLREALECYVVRKDSEENNLDTEWQHEIYSIYTEPNMNDKEREEFIEEFYITPKEIDVINRSKVKVDELDRKLLLYEMAECIRDNTFLPEEMGTLMSSYNISDDELKTIFYDFYIEFNKGVLQTKEQQEYSEGVNVEFEKLAEEKIQLYKQYMNEEQNVNDR